MDIVATPVSSSAIIEMNAGTTAGGKMIKRSCTLSGLRAGMGSVQAQMEAFYNFGGALGPCLAYPIIRAMVQDRVQIEAE